MEWWFLLPPEGSTFWTRISLGRKCWRKPTVPQSWKAEWEQNLISLLRLRNEAQHNEAAPLWAHRRAPVTHLCCAVRKVRASSAPSAAPGVGQEMSFQHGLCRTADFIPTATKWKSASRRKRRRAVFFPSRSSSNSFFQEKITIK